MTDNKTSLSGGASPEKNRPQDVKKAEERKENSPSSTETPSARTVENEAVFVEIEEAPHCVVLLTVEPREQILQEARKKALKSVRKEIDLPGFRKGKAPKEMVEKKYADVILERSRNEAANLSFSAALRLTQIPLLNEKSKVSYTPKSFTKDGALFTFSYETHPTIPDIDPKNYSPLGGSPQPIGEEEKEEAIRQMRFFYAKWDLIEDRGAQENDFVILDIESLDPSPTKVFSDTRFEIREKKIATWMKNLVIGKKAGDSIEGYSEPDEDASSEEKENFSKKRVLVTVKKVQTATLPPLDDEFVKKLGAKNVESFEKDIEKILVDKASQKFLEEEKQNINRFLLEEHPFAIPRSLVEAEVRHRQKQLREKDAKNPGELKKSPEEKRKAQEEILQQSEEAVRLFYLSRDIVRKSGISITEKEVQEEAKRTLQTFGPVHVDPSKIPQEVFALALSKVILHRAQEFILQGAKQS